MLPDARRAATTTDPETTMRTMSITALALWTALPFGCRERKVDPPEPVVYCEACLGAAPLGRCERLRVEPGHDEGHESLELGGFVLSLGRVIEHPDTLDVSIHVGTAAPRAPIWSFALGAGNFGSALPTEPSGFVGVQTIFHPTDGSALKLRCAAEPARSTP